MRGRHNWFRRALAPLTDEDFLRDYWESRSIAIPGGSDKHDGLHFDFERFALALERMPPGSVKASSVSATGEGTYTTIGAEEARSCFTAGMTICVTGIDHQVPELARLGRDTREALGLAGEVLCNCYLSPEGTGFGMHFDVQSVFLLQIEGSKYWQFADRPSIEFPPEATDALPAHRLDEYRRRHPAAVLQDPGDAQWLEHDLQPGGLLYMPPGTWHRGRAASYSLAITLTCCTHAFTNELIGLLERRLFGNSSWRRNLPAVIDGGPGNGLPMEVESFIESRLAELHQLVTALRPGDFASAWRSRVASRQE